MKYFKLSLLFGISLLIACSGLQKQNLSGSAEKKSGSSNDVFPYRGSYTRAFDLIHTKLEVSFNWQEQSLHGIANLQLRPYFYATDSLILDAKGLEVSSVFLLDTAGQKTSLSFKNDSLKLRIFLKNKYYRNDTLNLLIDYLAKPNELESKGSVAIDDDKGLYFINPLGRNELKPMQIWTQGETEASSCWFPTIDAPNEKTTQEIYITVDDKFKTLSNGTLINSNLNSDGTRTDYWKQKLPHAPYLFMMAIGDFAVTKHLWEGIPVDYYVEQKDTASAELVFGNTPKMLSFFSEKLGVKYPWDKFSQVIVKDYVSGAMENTSATIYGDFVMRDKRQLLDRNHEDIIAHELFHHWFGDLVTCESWSNLSLNESFATYGEYLWIEHHYGKLHADRHWYQDFLKYLNDEPWKPIINFHYDDKEDMFNRHSYEKGALVLHQLRQLVGDDAFFASLKLYLEQNKFKNAEIHHLRLAFEEVTGKDLNWYFNQWFLEKGHPELNFSYTVQSDSLIVNIEQNQVKKGIQAFYLPVELNIHSNGKIKKKAIEISEEKHQFIINTNDDISFVNINPNNGLLAVVNQKHTADEAMYVFSNSKHYKDKRHALLSVEGDSSATAWQLLDKSCKDSLEVFRRIGIHLLSKRPDAKSDEFKERLVRIAKEDTMSLVRAAAISSLSETFPKDSLLIPLYKKGLEDLSYEVNVQSITALHSIKREDALLRAVKLENEEDPRLLYTLSKLYADLDDESKIDFYIKTAKITEGYYKVAILSNFQTYLSSKSHEFIWKGLKEMKEIAIYDNDKEIREAAGLVIHELHQVHKKRLVDIAKDIADKEKSSKAKSNYDLKMLKEKQDELLEKEALIQTLINEVINAEKNNFVVQSWSNQGFVIEQVIEVVKQEENNPENPDKKSSEAKSTDQKLEDQINSEDK